MTKISRELIRLIDFRFGRLNFSAEIFFSKMFLFDRYVIFLKDQIYRV